MYLGGPQTAIVSSSPPLATVGTICSTIMQAAVGTTGRVRSARASRTAHGTSFRIRVIASVTMDNLFGQCALGCRTNLCSVTGTGKKVGRRGAHGSALPNPVWQLLWHQPRAEGTVFYLLHIGRRDEPRIKSN